MKTICLSFLFLLISQTDFCQSVQTEEESNKSSIILQESNKKYSLTAKFYGTNFGYGATGEKKAQIIQYVVLHDDKTGKEIRYTPTEDSSQATDFYFTDVWSPNEEFIVLPIGKNDGFGIFQASDALAKISENKYFDTIKVKSVNSGFFWHDFGKWENDSSFSFSAGLDGNMFAFKYDFAKSQLDCYAKECEKLDIGINNKGTVKPIKNGDIEPVKVH